MKRKYIFFLLIVIIIFILPSILTKKKKNIFAVSAENNNQEETSEVYPEYDYSKYSTINLFHSQSETIENLPIDEYLYGVVSSEMPASYEMEALKAQAIVARTYTIYQIINSSKHGENTICDNYACCQAWISKDERMSRWNENEAESNWKKICDAVDSTKGKIITYENNPIDAFFHSNSGGITETATDVWGGKNFPYLQVVETSGEDGYNQYSSEVILSKEELLSKIKDKYPEVQIDFNNENEIQILEYTQSGRVKTIKFGNINMSGTEARSLFGLKSTKFTYKIDNNNISFQVTGYGHGVGMSQTGADSMAKSGATAEDIIKHFYTNVEIKYVNEL